MISPSGLNLELASIATLVTVIISIFICIVLLLINVHKTNNCKDEIVKLNKKMHILKKSIEINDKK